MHSPSVFEQSKAIINWIFVYEALWQCKGNPHQIVIWDNKQGSGTAGILLYISSWQKANKSCCDILLWGVAKKATIPSCSETKTESIAAKTIHHKAFVSTNSNFKAKESCLPRRLTLIVLLFRKSKTTEGIIWGK